MAGKIYFYNEISLKAEVYFRLCKRAGKLFWKKF